MGDDSGWGGGEGAVMTLDVVLVFGIAFLEFDVSVFGLVVLGLWLWSFRLLGLWSCSRSLTPRYVCFYVCSVSISFSSLSVCPSRSFGQKTIVLV